MAGKGKAELFAAIRRASRGLCWPRDPLRLGGVGLGPVGLGGAA